MLYERATDVVCGKLCQVPVLIDALMFAYFIIHVGKKKLGNLILITNRARIEIKMESRKISFENLKTQIFVQVFLNHCPSIS